MENHWGWRKTLLFSQVTLHNSLNWSNGCLWLLLTSLVLLEKICKNGNASLQQIINSIPLVKFRYFGSFPSDYVPILPNETFVFIKPQPGIMQGEHRRRFSKSCHQLYFAHSLGRPSFLKQQYKQMMPQPLQSHLSFCGFYTIYAAFHLFKFRQEETTGFPDVNLLSLLGNYM